MRDGDTHSSVARSASLFLTGTFISRFTGMVRDLSMAYCFGTSYAVAGFLVAFRLANLLRRLFGEGALLNGFIPFFETIRKEDPKKGAEFFRDLFWSLSFSLLLIIITLEVILGGARYFFAARESVLQIIQMTMVMLPGILFICLFGLSMALLQCEKKFFLSGIAPVAFNIVWISSVWIFRHHTPYNAMMGISVGIVLAFFLQWWVTVPGLKRYVRQFLSLRDWFQTKIFSPELKKMIVPLFLGVVGVAAVQVNSAVDVIIACFSSLEGPAYLSYAHRLQQLPLALFGIAISSALMPPLTRAMKQGDQDHFKSLLSFGFSKTFSLLLPGTIAIFVLGGASVNLLYGRGMFSNLSTIHTTFCLWGYGLGLVPSAFVLILAPAFYAKKDFWTPTVASLWSVAINVILSLAAVFLFKMGASGIALATSIASFFNMGFLIYKLDIEVMKPLAKLFIKTAIAAVVAGLVTILLAHFMMGEPSLKMWLGNFDVLFSRGIFKQANEFGLLTLIFGVIFFTIAYFIQAELILEFFSARKESDT
jgi:putative peptidoglycan lipid II flippase